MRGSPAGAVAGADLVEDLELGRGGSPARSPAPTWSRTSSSLTAGDELGGVVEDLELGRGGGERGGGERGGGRWLARGRWAWTCRRGGGRATGSPASAGRRA